MNSVLDYKGYRGLRMLDIFERLNRGELLNKRELTQYYGVGGKPSSATSTIFGTT
ncbi:MAG: hypothetical protein K5982_04040 [Selenomonadaceae bacterium]|nr:hypothetical protein [Selenomonadaceae bacterium]